MNTDQTLSWYSHMADEGHVLLIEMRATIGSTSPPAAKAVGPIAGAGSGGFECSVKVVAGAGFEPATSGL
jgi:hypothetical protein